MPLALSRDPGPTPSVGHVTGDMKRRESNETQLENGVLRNGQCRGSLSPVPRPHPLTRRSGLVNQVEFLGLAGVLATV